MMTRREKPPSFITLTNGSWYTLYILEILAGLYRHQSVFFWRYFAFIGQGNGGKMSTSTNNFGGSPRSGWRAA